MKAAVFERTGGPEVLAVKEVELPRKSNEALIRVEATGVNRIDVWLRTGLYPVRLPHVLGVDVAGTVLEDPSETFKAGDRVLVYPNVGCGRCELCAAGEENLCPRMERVGQHRWGGYAETVAVHSRALIRIPDNLAFEEAASIPVNFLTAWDALVRAARISCNDSVLVVGAGSGVGYAAIQIAKLHGSKVIATVGSDEKVEMAHRIGADHVINRKKSDVVKEVMEITGGRGADVVFEHAGKEFWQTALKSLGLKGRLVTVGATTGQEVGIDIRALYNRRQYVIGAGVGSKPDLHRLLALFSEGRLRAHIDRVYRLEEAREAHRRMEASEHFGKIILRP
ncbi:MAG: zinc-binding dehydrogenase [Thaumarchaeota archaeon]|nr:zinc-binding dehydrogenase [Candidatus Calditenuaceae archaeon]MDW8041919.1 zinc-binding dehydrogenase [Nitrososphaerota archaeon]